MGDNFDKLIAAVAALRRERELYKARAAEVAPHFRPAGVDLLLDARSDPRITEVLTVLEGVRVKDYGNGQIAVGDIVKQVYTPPPALPLPDLPEHKAFAERFAGAIVARDLGAAHALLAPILNKTKTKSKLKAEIAAVSDHCGWPAKFEGASFGGLTVAELRAGKPFRLPKSIRDEDFRNWMRIQFLPEDGSDSDFAFDMGLALIDASGELKVGYYWMTNES